MQLDIIFPGVFQQNMDGWLLLLLGFCLWLNFGTKYPKQVGHDAEFTECRECRERLISQLERLSLDHSSHVCGTMYCAPMPSLNKIMVDLEYYFTLRRFARLNCDVPKYYSYTYKSKGKHLELYRNGVLFCIQLYGSFDANFIYGPMYVHKVGTEHRPNRKEMIELHMAYYGESWAPDAKEFATTSIKYA